MLSSATLYWTRVSRSFSDAGILIGTGEAWNCCLDLYQASEFPQACQIIRESMDIMTGGEMRQGDGERVAMMSLLYMQCFLKQPFSSREDVVALGKMIEMCKGPCDSLDLVAMQGKRAKVKAGSPTTASLISSTLQKMIRVCRCVAAILEDKTDEFERGLRVLRCGCWTPVKHRRIAAKTTTIAWRSSPSTC